MSRQQGVHPHDQPVRPAIALVVLAVAMGLMWAVAEVISRILVRNLLSSELAPGAEATFYVIFAITAVMGLLMLGLGLAAFIVAVVVAVKGDGKLRLGAGLMIAASLFEMVIYFNVSGDSSQFSEAAIAVSNAFTIVELVVNVLRVLALIVGAVILILGIREVRRERAELATR